MLKSIIAAAVVVAALPAVAGAAEGSAKFTIRDLDLTSVAGRATLKQRIETATRAACGAPDLGSRSDVEVKMNCRRALSYDARDQVRLHLAAQPSTNALAAR